MKFLVCISKTTDTTSKIGFNDKADALIEDGIQFILNPYDEWYSLVKALELKEQLGGSVDVIHVGNNNADILIRKALAIGADAAIRIDEEPSNSYSVACQIAEFAKDKSYDLIFTGKETIDYNSAEIGSMIAEHLNLPYASHCNNLEWNEGKALCSCEVEGGSRVIEIATPFVISSCKGIAEQRIPNMKGIIDAKKKPLDVIKIDSVEALAKLYKFELPPAKTGVRMIDPSNIDELVSILKDELKII